MEKRRRAKQGAYPGIFAPRNPKEPMDPITCLNHLSQRRGRPIAPVTFASR